MREMRALFFTDQIKIFERHVWFITADERKPQGWGVDDADDGTMFDSEEISFGLFGEGVETLERRVVILVDQASDP